MNDSVIAGALFDFMGWLTSRKEHIVLSSVDEASSAVDAIRDFAKMRGLSLDNAQVQTWQEALTQPEQEPWCMRMNGCKTKCEDCPVEVAQPEQDTVQRLRALVRAQQITIDKLEAQSEQEPVIDGNTSDGYHTFNELYEFRKAYNIALFNEWAANGKCSVHKSWRHNDGELCFGGGWFIVVAVLPQGQISNHYEAKDWDLFHIQETGKALFEFDGHTGANVIERLKSYTTPPQRTWVGLSLTQVKLLSEGVQEEAVKSGDSYNWVFYKHINEALKDKNT